jgi:hypothetical protein
VEVTLGRPAGELEWVSLSGWQRDWSMVVENALRPHRYELHPGGEIPEYTLALNLQALDGSTVNGALVGLNEAELEAMDDRESQYDRIDVTGQIVGAHGFERVYTYVGRPMHLWHQGVAAIVPASYVRVVEEGFAEGGADQLRLFWASTLAAPCPVAETVFPQDLELLAAS